MPEVLTRRPAERPSFSIPSIIAAVCVVLTFFTEWLDPLFAILAIGFGALGAFMAMAPSVRGGIISIASIIAGILIIIVSLFQIVF